MKEHTIFATVFLILVVGFVSFNVGGATGEVFEDRQWRATFADSQYTGPVTTGGHSAREFESTNLVANIPETGYSDSYGRTEGVVLGERPMAIYGADTWNWKNIYSGIVDTELDYSTFRNCILQATSSRNQVSIEEGNYNLTNQKMTKSCPDASELAIDKDGILSVTRDNKAYKALQRGMFTEGWGAITSGKLLCSRVGETYKVGGRLGTCMETENTPWSPNTYYSKNKRIGVFEYI